MTKSTTEFMCQIDSEWDTITPYESTRNAGYLAEVDETALREICELRGDDYITTEREVMGLIANQCAICGV